MIVKFFELKKKNLENKNYFLLYGKNRGLIQETLDETIKHSLKGNIFKYEESEIIKNIENFKENLTNKSFFDDKKIIIINRSTDKIFPIMSEIIEMKVNDISIILISENLEKRSKLRNFFEKNKETIIIPFYEDNRQSLNLVAREFLKKKKILLSQENINLIIERSRGDRINLYNELEKIDNFSKNKKQIKTSDILKLTNLSQNFDISELVDSTLSKEKKKTFYILNENNFSTEDTILIIRIFVNKLKRLLKIKTQINFEGNIENTLLNFKPPIFWKEKDLLKKQIKIWDHKKIERLLIETSKMEVLIKKNPSISLNLVTNFILEQTV